MNNGDLTFFDGTKSVPLQALPEAAWRYLTGQGEGSDFGALKAFKSVVWAYRAVDLRAKKVASMPYALMKGSQDVTESEQYQQLQRKIRSNLYRTEAGLCVYGEGYWKLEANQLGLNVTPRWLLPKSIEWMADDQGQLSFKRHLNNRSFDIPPEQLIYFWLPTIEAEIGPGIAPMDVALGAGRVLYNLDMIKALFFQRGLIRATLLSVEGNPPQAEMEKLQSWWKRLLGGSKKAHETVAIKAAVKPVMIGDGLDALKDKEVAEPSREDILSAFGVTYSLVVSDAANYATAQQDWLNFYDQTIVPEVELIYEAINDQWLSRYGLELKPLKNRLECYQQLELQKANAVREVTGSSVMSIDEGRAWLSLDGKLAESLQEKAEVAKQLRDLGYSLEQSAALVGLPTPIAAEPEPTPEPPQDQPPDESTPELTTQDAPEGDQTVAKAVDLDKWQRKALKRLAGGKGAACTFESPHISSVEHAAVLAHLQQAETAEQVKAAFASLKAAKDDFSEMEQELVDEIEPALLQMGRDVADTIERGGTPDVARLADSLRGALMTALVRAYTQQVQTLVEQVKIDLDPAVVTTRASDWARSYSFELIKGLNERTQSVVQAAVSQYSSTPGMTREQLVSLLEGAFGRRRAEAIAVTEATRAAAQAAAGYQAELTIAGIQMERVNRTNNDDLVCPICAPLNGTPESEWPDLSGPPWHVKCRCFVTLRAVRDA